MVVTLFYFNVTLIQKYIHYTTFCWTYCCYCCYCYCYCYCYCHHHHHHHYDDYEYYPGFWCPVEPLLPSFVSPAAVLVRIARNWANLDLHTPWQTGFGFGASLILLMEEIRSPANQLRLVVEPIIYKVYLFYTCQVVVWDSIKSTLRHMSHTKKCPSQYAGWWIAKGMRRTTITQC